MQFGLIGTGVMGRNLALNILDHGYSVAAWNLERDLLDLAVDESAGRLAPMGSLKALVAGLSKPRRILIMIKAGKPVDSVLDSLGSLLDEGDIVIDGGNSLFRDTERRQRGWEAKGIHFVGMGVSGGEDGARYGPSLMPGGSAYAYSELEPVLKAVAATSDSGACVTHVGGGGSGHFVKMVHNGIEYADMQGIAEAYHVLGTVGGLDNDAMASAFNAWNDGALESFLIEITAAILTRRDDDGHWVDQVLDRAGQKGTGRWTAELALELGISIPSIAGAIDARVLSSAKPLRQQLSRHYAAPSNVSETGNWLSAVGDALLVSRIAGYAQGMDLIREGSAVYEWSIDLSEIARIWKAGCIIRSRFLDTITEAYRRDPALPHLFLDGQVHDALQRSVQGLRDVVGVAVASGIPVPVMQSSLAYFDSLRTERLPQNLTQAQRDAFGAHRFQTLDDPDGESVHRDWLGDSGS